MAGAPTLTFLSPQLKTTAIFATSCFNTLSNGGISILFNNPSSRFFCKCSQSKHYSQTALKYIEAFSTRMNMAALKPHHRIAVGVSGGADSMALCTLVAYWKTTFNGACFDDSGFVDGLLAIIVDHDLRSESKEEARTVSRWMSDMGIKCQVMHCDWPDGRPKVGHLEEMAREMRYKIFQDVCFQNQIGVLLTAHHADDQAELFILRLSRNSGVLGLAGMPFTSQLFPELPCFVDDYSGKEGILLVRPLMEFTKEDLYKICDTNNLEWVEDPSNRSSLFARNRIRMALHVLKTGGFRSELQGLITFCRQTRLYIDYICQLMLDQAVTIMPLGYAVIDLRSLKPWEREEICLTRFLALVVQFISQRHRPVRGSALRLMLDYIRIFPCKTSLTAAGCYLCAAPGSKGTIVLVCCSVQSSPPSQTELYSTYLGKVQKRFFSYDVEHIVEDQKSLLKHLVPDATHVHFLNASSSDSILVEARRLEVICESTYNSIIELEMKEKELFKSKPDVVCTAELKDEVESRPITKPFQPGQSCYFMSRFLLTWIPTDEIYSSFSSLEIDDVVAYVRHMIDEDWLFLAKLSKVRDSNGQMYLNNEKEQMTDRISLISNYGRSSAQQALKKLKYIPVAARRGLPVIVSTEGFLLSIPSIGFSCCPSLAISAQFRPRVPLGGGHSSFL